VKVLLAACEALPQGDGDDEVLLHALRDVGCEADWIVWSDPAAPIADADLVILRATWDYDGRRDQFLAWCESLPLLRNAPAIARWNTDKAYLLDLAAAGLQIVPTELVAPGADARWPDTEFVVKPSVGAGSRGAQRFAAGDAAAAGAHLTKLHARGKAALVQPYQSTVDADGETAVVFIAGQYSHAFVKGPLLVPDAGLHDSGLYAPETLHADDPGPELRKFAEDAIDAGAEVLGIRREELLYARVDVVRGADDSPLLLELEVTEPSLGFEFGGPAAARRMADAARAAAGG
jgi:glutathione synthase/RimK-type ligase-like ATP-grasp enzyme